jgi:hypothetical protein
MEQSAHDVTGLNGIDIDFTHFEKPYVEGVKTSKIKAIARWKVSSSGRDINAVLTKKVTAGNSSTTGTATA